MGDLLHLSGAPPPLPEMPDKHRESPDAPELLGYKDPVEIRAEADPIYTDTIGDVFEMVGDKGDGSVLPPATVFP